MIIPESRFCIKCINENIKISFFNKYIDMKCQENSI